MASLPTTLILLSVLFSGLLYANGRTADLVSTLTEQSQFDFFTLALQWPATFCSTHENKCCPENGCCQGSKTLPGFTIHGLWPDFSDGSWPSCCPGPAFDEEKIVPLLDALHTYWPILSCNDVTSCNNKMKSFWADQWEKHGTCTTSVTGDQFGYFLKTLELYLKYNVTDVLLKAKYKPSNSKTYPTATLVSTIENAFSAKPQLVCKNDNIVKEVRLCFTKDFKPRECVEPSGCPQYVRLPKFAFLDGTSKTEDLLISAIKSVV